MAEQPYRYRALDLDSKEIRILQITSIDDDGGVAVYLKHINLSTKLDYKALSYTWGAESPLHEIHITDEHGSKGTIKVRQNLYDFLEMTARKLDTSNHGSAWYWIDQISIEQDDVDERNHQVAQMAQIYQTAAAVHIWLGPECSQSRYLMLGLSGLHEASKRTEEDMDTHQFTPAESHAFFGGLQSRLHQSSTTVADVLRAYPALQDLVDLAIWNRLWITQEIILGQHASLLWGGLHAPLAGLSKLIMVMSGHSAFAELGSGFKRVQTLLYFRTRWRFTSPFRMQQAQLLTRDAQCWDVRDRIYGLQALLPVFYRIPVDYGSSAMQVWRSIVKTYTEQRFIEIRESHSVSKNTSGLDEYQLLAVRDVAKTWQDILLPDLPVGERMQEIKSVVEAEVHIQNARYCSWGWQMIYKKQLQYMLAKWK